jgi:hypothetical protein
LGAIRSLSSPLVAASFRDLLYSPIRAVAERNASWERRPQQIFSRGTFRECPETKRAFHLCARPPRQRRGCE